MSGAAIAIILLLATPQQSAEHTGVSDQHQKPATYAPKPSAAAVPHEVLPGDSERNGNGKGNGRAGVADPWRHADFVQLAAAIFTGLYFLATVWILCEMRRSNRRALSLSLASNRETKKAANAAELSAKTAKRALRLAERAVVLIEAIRLDESSPLYSITPTTTFTLVLRNYGRTTANDVSFRIDFPATETAGGGDAAIALGPSGTHEYDFRPLFNMTPVDVEYVGSGQRPWNAHIDITYLDVFDQRHHTVATAYYQHVLRKIVLHHLAVG